MTVDRKAAARAFKERVPVRGVFVLRATASGRAWVGPSRDLVAEEGRLRFFLAQGHHRDRMLQQTWNHDGGDTFAFEVLESLDPDLAPLLVPDALKARTAAWAAELGAGIVLP